MAFLGQEPKSTVFTRAEELFKRAKASEEKIEAARTAKAEADAPGAPNWGNIILWGAFAGLAVVFGRRLLG